MFKFQTLPKEAQGVAWMGFGGSIFQWNREREIGFGYVPTSLHAIDLFNERGKEYQREVLRCVEKRGTS